MRKEIWDGGAPSRFAWQSSPSLALELFSYLFVYSYNVDGFQSNSFLSLSLSVSNECTWCFSFDKKQLLQDKINFKFLCYSLSYNDQLTFIIKRKLRKKKISQKGNRLQMSGTETTTTITTKTFYSMHTK